MRQTLFLASLALAGASFAAPIKLAVATFEPSVGEPVFPAGLATASHERFGLKIVQFSGVVGEDQRESLRQAGAHVLDYLPDNAFLVRGDLGTLSSVNGVVWTGNYHPAYRLSPEIGTRTLIAPERRAEAAAGLLRVAVTLTRDASAEMSRLMLGALGVNFISEGTVGDQSVFLVTGTRAQIENIARNESVQFIEEAGEVTERNSTTRWIVQTNVSGNTPFYTAGITGAGMIVGVLDSRISQSHTSFSDTAPIGPTHRKIVYYGTTAGQASHGTHVAGTIAGDAGVFDDRRGIAYGAKIAYSLIPTNTETTLYSALVTHQNQGARDHTNSWGDDATEAYTGWARAVDRFSWDYEDSLVTFAITNLKNVLKTPENAKSSMSVGATMDTPNQNSIPSGFSGKGPTADLRRKPEVVAPGDGTISSSSTNPTGTTVLSGTSMATPAATGAAVLVRQFLKDGRIYNGSPNAAYTVNASGALLRAMMITTAVPITTLEPGYPTGEQGFGRVLIDNVLALPGDSRRTIVHDVRNANGQTTGQSTTYRFRINSNAQPLRVTLAFTDFPAAAGVVSAAVNNLDLTVTNPSGQVYKGNVFSGGVSVTGGVADLINSAEMVSIPTPTAGLYTVTVNATAIVSGPQGHALVINGAVVRSQITGTLALGNWMGTIPSTVPVTFLDGAGNPYPGGSVNAAVTPGTGAYSVEAPPTVTGSYRLRFNLGAHLLKTVPSPASPASTDLFAAQGTVNLINGDPDRSGEVDAADIDLAIANFGNVGGLPTGGDVDGSGEVDAADIDVIIANFGSVNN